MDALTSDMTAQAGLAQDLQQKLRLEELRGKLTPRESNEKKLRGACQGFESVFVNKLLTQMRSTLPKDGFLHSKYEDQYLSMFDQELADKISKDGGIGIAQMMYDQLSNKLHPKQPNSAQAGDIYTNNAIGRFPQTKSKSLRSDITPKDGARPFGGAGRRQQYVPTPVATGPNAAAQPQAQANITPGGAMATPCDGEVSSEFGWRTDPTSGRRAWHAGVDLKAAQGTPVDACWNGKVIFAGERGGYGKCVVLEHDGGWQSIYGHNSNILVRSGEAVSAGQKIAEVGDTGKSTGAHLHFELRQAGVAYDPIKVQLAALDSPEKAKPAAGETQVASR